MKKKDYGDDESDVERRKDSTKLSVRTKAANRRSAQIV